MITKINQAPKAVIFDFDDTLLATFEVRCNAFIQAAAQFKYHISEAVVRKNWGKPLPQFIFDVLPGVDVDAFEKYYLEYVKKHPSRLLPGAIDILNTLYEKSIIMIIVSASSNQVLLQDMQRTKIYHYFSFIYGANDTIYHKPDPRSLHPALENLRKHHINKNETLYIGDSIRDYHAARDNHVLFIGVLTGLDIRTSFIKNGLDACLIAKDLQEVAVMLY